MLYVDMETFITTIYYIVDNWFLAEGHLYLKGKAGKKPVFTDSELLTLVILKEFLPFKSERKFLGFIHANYIDVFHNLLDQSQFNRRSRSLRLILNKLRCYLAE